LRPRNGDFRRALRRHPESGVSAGRRLGMRTDAMTIQSLVTADAATDALPHLALGARVARILAIAATVLATTLAVLLASGLAVMINLS
jgi:hypothetical protein